MKLRSCILFVFLVFSSCLVFAQQSQDTGYYRVTTQDGNEYFGRILSRDSATVVLRTDKLGDLTIRAADIKAIGPVDRTRIVKGEYWDQNPQSSRYFWAPSGYGLRKGEGYYQNVWIFFNQVSYGITNNVTIGAGIVPLFIFAGESTPVWITPKVSFPVVKDKVNLGIGAMLGTVIGEENSGFGILYGSGTFGTRDKNITFGAGWGFAGGEMTKTPTLNLSAMLRVARRWYLLTENYYIGLQEEDPVTLLSFGARYAPRNIGVDFGLFVPATGIDGWVAIPWLGICVPFGNKR
jgi:hypothetical protein